MTWWIWVLAGLALLALEVAIPGGIVMLFFGVAALIVGLMVALGVGGPLWFQAAMFSVVSVVSLLTLRGPILRRIDSTTASSKTIDTLAGKDAVLLSDIAPGAEGKVELRGTSWTAQNIGSEPLTTGQRCTVERADGLTLFIR